LTTDVSAVHPVLGAELGVDAGARRRIVEVRSEREQLAAAGLERVELTADHILQVVVRSGTGWRQGDASGPVEQWGPRVVERVRRRS
jgi:hypothetical protein